MFVAQQRLKLFNPFSGKYCRHNFSSPDTLNIVVIFWFISLWASFFLAFALFAPIICLGPADTTAVFTYIFKIRSHVVVYVLRFYVCAVHPLFSVCVQMDCRDLFSTFFSFIPKNSYWYLPWGLLYLCCRNCLYVTVMGLLVLSGSFCGHYLLIICMYIVKVVLALFCSNSFVILIIVSWYQ